MPLTPTTMFCCGCSTPVGTLIILFFHLVASAVYLGLAFSSMVLMAPSFVFTWNPWLQFVIFGWTMCGIPIILSAMYGVWKRLEMNVRIYLGYLLVCFVIDSVGLLYVLWHNDSCNVPGSNFNKKLTSDFGRSFMCGTLRIVSYLGVAACINIEVYCLYVVWSFCEDVHFGSSGPGLWELIPGKAAAFGKKSHLGEREGPYADIVGLSHAALPGPYPSAYGSLEGADGIFGESQNAINFSPKAEWSRW